MTRVHLQPMPAHHFAAYAQESMQEYAEEKQKAGVTPAEDAYGQAVAEFQTLLPAGYRTPGHHFLSIINLAGEQIGIIWLYDVQAASGAFIYDFRIFKPFRGRGCSQDALEALFQLCRAEGIRKLSLHVFAHNGRARHVYQKLGFRETDLQMTKWLM
ncbi:MAG: GNAT family N-acetyltransferase [Sporolactobacillus sp.]